MPITENNLLQHELIGLRAKIVQSTNPSLANKEGVIVDETRNTLVLKENESLKIIPKQDVRLRLNLPEGKKVKVDGRKLIARAENRIKKYG
ncbi:hypothetical protein AKJ45_00455 [candidate division MSBL1 archaeon SCGC-AAA261F19]|uniref:Ribonuclease P protein component 1 n=2 Tax=candidate division MSBL1 TaxID=215777 RepID=A0A133VBM5_9EURY|nr:hypothetical protein AKJ43_00450 [candidate division MSBL1 archaeon SCGC-AAA261D19]KXB03794.1 hypothetical protein AKJ45_00455 [candidate division MSBL1 archaeon SCGC-AAA261F19]